MRRIRGWSRVLDPGGAGWVDACRRDARSDCYARVGYDLRPVAHRPCSKTPFAGLNSPPPTASPHQTPKFSWRLRESLIDRADSALGSSPREGPVPQRSGHRLLPRASRSHEPRRITHGEGRCRTQPGVEAGHGTQQPHHAGQQRRRHEPSAADEVRRRRVPSRGQLLPSGSAPGLPSRLPSSPTCSTCSRPLTPPTQKPFRHVRRRKSSSTRSPFRVAAFSTRCSPPRRFSPRLSRRLFNRTRLASAIRPPLGPSRTPRRGGQAPRAGAVAGTRPSRGGRDAPRPAARRLADGHRARGRRRASPAAPPRARSRRCETNRCPLHLINTTDPDTTDEAHP